MKKIGQSIITKRVLWTVFFLFIYCLGNRLVLPFVDLKNATIFGGAMGSLGFSSAMMGGNLSSVSLFSVGLSPWMSAMILWQMFSFSKKMGLKNLPVEIQERRRMYLTLAIALVQSLAVSLNLPIVSGVNGGLAVFMNTILLISGTFFLVWLSDLNSLFGIGGSIVILMASMMVNLPYQIMDSIEKLGIGWDVLLPLILFSLIFLYVSGIVQRARYRIPINKINIHNRFKQYSYLDIMLNPAGGMPFMYAMSLVSIPQYVFMLIQFMHPENKWASEATKSLTVGRPLWLVIYLVMLFVLGLAFAFVNVSGEQISESQSVSNSVSASESASISESQSVSNSESASTSESQSVSNSESASESGSISESQSVSTSESASESASISESQSVSNSESVSESASISESQSVSNSESASTSELISESQSVSNSESASESASISTSESISLSESQSASASVPESSSSSVSISASTSASESSSEVKDPKQKRGSHALPKTGEENSSLSMIFGALATATGLAFLAKRKKDEEGEDY
ncbi:accessory Sec system protein translocase subunit SecY2 [Streptococcus vestibularis]|uniref:Accessory Sec system protein translocase subunit SecY2 n=1 Tax=Streptococcus vestibularis TaxID=1343 RepID=A0AAW7QHP5_STRVE|nr:accessory Sec system protein translocase subunit SecY2 [Streptococcus vestibularis]MDN5268660.1 accessory Sec system protein translocase subunit SecY2 [Streptococcus vestibularis]